MVNGFITYDELKTITGLDDSLLKQLLKDGLCFSELDYTPKDCRFKNMSQMLFDFDQVQRWIGLHIY